MLSLRVATLALLGLAGVHVSCHPGSHVSSEAMARRTFLSQRPQAVQDCRRGADDAVSAMQMHRRWKMADELSPDHGTGIHFFNLGKPYVRRHFRTIDKTDHQAHDDEKLLFADYSNYVLQPIVTSGPYFVSGELIRRDISESQVGVPLVLDLQFINTRTCLPIKDLFVEVWQANATGCYSGVASPDNGHSLATLDVDDSGEKQMTGGTVNESWLRGVQKTEADGLVQFQTIFPGWYEGRATHIHLLAHNPPSVQRLSNDTVVSEWTAANHTVRASHVGQVFFDTLLLDRIAQTHPYSANSQRRIKNEEDAVLMQEGHVSDPVLQYVMLGDGIEDGIFAWVTIGIDPEASVEVKVAASWFGSWGRMWRKLWRSAV